MSEYDTSGFSSVNQTQHINVLYCTGWRLGVVVSVVGRINEVNQHRARLVHVG